MAELDLSDFVRSVCQTCDESELVTSYNVRILDNTNEVYGSYFDDQPPARTTVEVARLPKGVRLEVAMIATVP